MTENTSACRALARDERSYAYHEAGHAVMVVLLGKVVNYATIDPVAGRSADATVHWGWTPACPPHTELLISCAGPAAQYRAGRGDHGSGGDYRKARPLAATV